MLLSPGARRRTPALVVPFVLLAAACAPGETGAPEVSAPSPVPPESLPVPVVTPWPDDPAGPCPDDGVRVTPGPVDAALGLRALRVSLENCGDEPYAVEGYPVFLVLDEDADVLDVAVTHDPADFTPVESFDAPATGGVLPPGGTAYTDLLWRNTVTDATRPATLGVEMTFTLGEGPPHPVRPDGGLDLGTTDLLAVSPWVLPKEA